MNTLLTLRNNWKKSVFFTSVLGYASYSFKSHIDVTSHMRDLCRDLVNNYDERNQPPRILVVLNPAANKKNAEKMFKQFAEPILHLSGYEIEIFKTQKMGHAKTFIESLPELPDAIVVAGGEGTSSEVVTGLLRRLDEPCPLVILPLGSKSEKNVKKSSKLFNGNLAYIKAVTTSSLSLVKGTPHYKNVIQYDVVGEDEEKKLKPVYGLGGFSWGIIKDIDSLKNKYWLFGSLRNYAALLFNSFSNKLVWHFETDYLYTPPCSGCTNCFFNNKPKITQNKSGSFLNRFVPYNKAFTDSSKLSTAPKVLNEECLKVKEGHIRTSQLDIDCKPNEQNFFELETRIVDKINPGLDTLKNMKKIINKNVEPSLVLRSRTIELSPSLSPDTETFYSIDGEEYDARPIKISIIQNAIKVYS